MPPAQLATTLALYTTAHAMSFRPVPWVRLAGLRQMEALLDACGGEIKRGVG